MKSDEEQLFFDEIWKFWTPKGAEVPPCLVCYKEAVTLHEINPKSTNPDWLSEPFNSIPICNKCHDEAQLDPVSNGIKLRVLVTDRLHNIADWRGISYDRIIRELYQE